MLCWAPNAAPACFSPWQLHTPGPFVNGRTDRWNDLPKVHAGRKRRVKWGLEPIAWTAGAGKGRHGRSKTSWAGAGATSGTFLSFMEAAAPAAGVHRASCAHRASQWWHFTQQQESVHPGYVFASWLLNLFPKSLWQILNTPQMNYFSLHTTQVDASPFLCKKSSCSAITRNAGSEWKLMLLMKPVV